MRNTKVQKMIAISMLAAISVVLQFVAFPIIPAFSFLKIDFSDIAVMISMFLFGPMAGVTTAFLRSSLHFFMEGASPQHFIGNAASFLATLAFVFPIYGFMQAKNHKMASKVMGSLSGTLSMTFLMSLANYFVITPFYLKLFGLSANEYLGMSMAKYLAIGIIPFNLIKGIIVSIVFVVLYTKLLPWIFKKTHVVKE